MVGQLIHIREPQLTFGYNQVASDPRDGLILFGPYTRNSLEGAISVGVIGPEKLRMKVEDYIRAIHKPIFTTQADLARPYFPGIESAFNVRIGDNIPQIEVPQDEIDRYLKYTDPHQRVHNLVNMYAKRLTKYVHEEEVPVTVWFVAIPDEIYTYGRPKSRIPKADDNIKVGLRKRDRNKDQISLFQEIDELKEAYEYEVNFHHQLKAKLLDDKVITQIVRQSTIDYKNLWKDEKRIAAEEKFDSAKAWNLATTLYYKAGGLPWKLGEVRDRVCYLGLVYKKVDKNERSANACCAAQMFLNSGDGHVFRGNIGPWYNPNTGEFHLNGDDAYDLLSRSLDTFRSKSETGDYPEEVFIHGKTYFETEEWSAFERAAEGKSKITGVRIRDDRIAKLYRDFSYCIPRGSCLVLNEHEAFLWTKGFIPRIQTQMGLETPNPIRIEITRGKSRIENVCKDVLSLTKLNYNSCIYGDGMPVTLRFANSIGEVLTAGPSASAQVLPFKHYL